MGWGEHEESEFFCSNSLQKKERKNKGEKTSSKRTDSLQVEPSSFLGLAVRELVERDLGVALVHLDAGGALVGL